MVVEGADRFGLAQLHQLRGRVGRGPYASYCLLVADPQTEAAKRRIDALRKTDDGFAIAEMDLALRGPGELAGVKQAGPLEFLAAEFPKDLDLAAAAREEARGALDGGAGGGGRPWAGRAAGAPGAAGSKSPKGMRPGPPRTG